MGLVMLRMVPRRSVMQMVVMGMRSFGTPCRRTHSTRCQHKYRQHQHPTDSNVFAFHGLQDLWLSQM